jgi:hypothetical protein
VKERTIDDLRSVSVSDRVFRQLCQLIASRHARVTEPVVKVGDAQHRTISAEIDGMFAFKAVPRFKGDNPSPMEWQVAYDPQVITFGLAQDNPAKGTGQG